MKVKITYSTHARMFAALAIVAFGAAAPAHAQVPVAAKVADKTSACPAILKQTFNKLQDETPQNLCQYAGKVVLVVNTASFCGYTQQYEGLEALYAKYAAKGLVVLGFPSNDFGQQEPGSSKQIADLCYNTYGVKFPMFAKTVVSGAHPNALFSSLIKATGTAPGWNFHKYLIDSKGNVIAQFPSQVTPLDKKLTDRIELALVK
jgi:glutathione peroxidase